MSELYKFADFELDGARFELRRAGQSVTVQPKVLRMLLLLVRERERVVSTEELFRALWPGERVGPSSIRRAVRGLRKALGESAESQHSIRTVRGFGYQFQLPVSIGAASAPVVAPPAPAPVVGERAAAPVVAQRAPAPSVGERAAAPIVAQRAPAQSWPSDLAALSSADTLPLFGGPAKLLRDQALQAWQRSRSTSC